MELKFLILSLVYEAGFFILHLYKFSAYVSPSSSPKGMELLYYVKGPSSDFSKYTMKMTYNLHLLKKP